MQSNTNILAHVTAFVVAMIWGSTFISTKVLIMSGLSPVQIFTLRFILAYLLLLGWDWARKSVSSPQSVQGDDKDSFHLFCNNWKDELLMIGLGVTGGSAYFYTENEALRFSTATNVSLIVCSCPLVTTLLFRFVFKEIHLSMTLKVGGSLGVCGNGSGSVKRTVCFASLTVG